MSATGRPCSTSPPGRLASTTDAEDVTQATFVAAWLGREGFDPPRGSMLGWLLGIARRKVVDQIRATARDDRITDSVRRLAPVGEVKAPPDRVVDRLVVADEMAQLPGEQRRVLELAFYDDLTHPQIAAVTGLPLGTVKSHMRRGMAATTTVDGRWTVSHLEPERLVFWRSVRRPSTSTRPATSTRAGSAAPRWTSCATWPAWAGRPSGCVSCRRRRSTCGSGSARSWRPPTGPRPAVTLQTDPPPARARHTHQQPSPHHRDVDDMRRRRRRGGARRKRLMAGRSVQ